MNQIMIMLLANHLMASAAPKPPPQQLPVKPTIVAQATVTRGAPAKEVQDAFGKPADVYMVMGDEQWLYINGPCEFISCSVIIHDGKATEFYEIKQELIR